MSTKALERSRRGRGRGGNSLAFAINASATEAVGLRLVAFSLEAHSAALILAVACKVPV